MKTIHAVVITENASISEIERLIEPFSNNKLSQEGRFFYNKWEALAEMKLYRERLRDYALEPASSCYERIREDSSFRNHVKKVLFAENDWDLLEEFPRRFGKKDKIRWSAKDNAFLTFENEIGIWDSYEISSKTQKIILKDGTRALSARICDVDWEEMKKRAVVELLLNADGSWDGDGTFDFDEYFYSNKVQKLVEWESQKYATIVRFVQEIKPSPILE